MAIFMHVLRTAAISILAVLHAAACQADIVPLPELQYTNLLSRYRLGTITVTASTLTSFRYHLNDRDRRKILDGESEPIPQACRLMTRYLGQVYQSFLKPGLGIALLQINLATNRAYVKPEADFTGSLVELEWTPAEVRSVAILVDVLLRGIEVAKTASASPPKSGAGLIESWQIFSVLSKNPYIPPAGLTGYLRSIASLAAATNETPIIQAKEIDPRAYSEIMTFYSNSKQIELATRKALGEQGKGKMDFLLEPRQLFSGREYENVAGAVLLEQAIAAKGLKKLTDEEASKISALQVAPAYSKYLKNGSYEANLTENFDYLLPSQNWILKGTRDQKFPSAF